MIFQISQLAYDYGSCNGCIHAFADIIFNSEAEKETSQMIVVFFAFVKERFHNAVEIDILGIFGRSFIVTNLAPPKNSSGANSSAANDVIANRPCALSGSRFPSRVGAACLYVESLHLLFAFGVLACRILNCASLLYGLLSSKLRCLLLKIELLAF